MITREDYLNNGSQLHRAYYAQFNKLNNYEKYQEMWTKWQNGQINHTTWMTFCMDFLMNTILTDPDIVAVMKRLRDR